ncbi:hypothetical protein [Sphingomonas sp.]|uniref:hypothetical protein n=1 Tax=Sphingomonas sp. TaxID=28214 RepID=UPI001B14F790|nr:hypothetical protein [Sphingomonas sp.]MBO9712280.1 hypothetical protein [Sphingomonas sp.]
MSDYEFSIDGASCRIWPDGPAWEGAPAAAIGQLRIENPQAGADLLRRAVVELEGRGRARILAPMDGDTWHAYRAVTQSDGSPPYLLEPVSGPHDVAALKAAGFPPVTGYVSSRAPVPPPGSPAPDVPGITVQAWDGQGAETLLDRLFALAGASFADKLFFKPIDRAGFLALYQPLLARIDPRLVLFAFDASGDLAGFLFGLPNWREGPSPETAILKTYASRRAGVGHLLAHEFHERAREQGYAQVIHALMHVDNVSLARSALHGGEVFRRYTLFGRR